MLKERARTKEQRALILEENIVSLKMWRCQGGHPADVDCTDRRQSYQKY